MIGRFGASLVRLPGDAPLRLPPLTVGVEQRAVLAGWPEPTDRCLAEMMYEDILRTDDSITGVPDAHRIIVVFEEADFETLVERTDFVPHIAP